MVNTSLKLRVLVIDESPERAAVLRHGLELGGHQVVAALPNAFDLLKHVESLQPDVIIIDTESPSRDVLEHVVMVSRDQPRPIVMFATDSDTLTIREAVKAGVSAYIVDGLGAGRVQPIIDVAMARFEEFQALRNQLEQATTKLSERKLIERAKGILMKSRKLPEQEAYDSLRRTAMARNLSVAELARQVIAMSELMG
jgi:response regulator NasT